ncbi:MAG: pyridoxamine 5'-phosphate oxidase family protein [Polyangia bacterium]
MGTYDARNIEKTNLAEEKPFDQRAHVHAMLEELSDVMLTSFERTGDAPIARARPMHVTHLDQDDSLWFMTSIDAEGTVELQRTPTSSVIAQSSSSYVSLQGKSTIVTDRTRIKAMWKKMHEVWFPDGPEDPKVCLVHFVPTEADFWDVSTTLGVKYLFQVAKALITGEPPKSDPKQHGSMKL